MANSMGLFARLARLIKSNINDLISRSEDPEKMLHQIIIDMNSQLLEAKKQVAASIADEKRLAKQVDAEQAKAAGWEKRAMMAVRAGDDNLAREALTRKAEHGELTEQYRQQWQKQKQAVEQLKLALRALNGKIEEAKRKKSLLIARKKRAEAQKAIQETMSGLKNASAFEAFDRMEGRVHQMEAEAEAAAELHEEATGDVLAHRFREMEATQGAEDDLLALKRKMGLLPPAPIPAEAERAEGMRAEGTRGEAVRVENDLGELDPEEQAELERALAELEAEENRQLTRKS